MYQLKRLCEQKCEILKRRSRMIYQNDNLLPRGYFFELPKNLFDLGLSPYAIVIYAYLMCKKNRRNQCWPSIELIAEKCGIGSTNTVLKYLNELEENGMINITQQMNYITHKRSSNLYDLLYIDLGQKKRR